MNADLVLQSTHEPDPEQEYVLGIDEAGRGPILGPMVYACAYYAKADTVKFTKLGFMDSKQLSEEKRDTLFDKIKTSTAVKIGWQALVLSAEELSHKMLNTTRVSLNEISHEAAMNLIELTLKKGFKVTEVFVDTVGDPEKYRRKLRYKFPEIEITVSKKADSLYPSVSAASICAKVTRDHVLANWQFSEKNLHASTEFGSGYPSDPKTKQWIKENIDKVFGFPNLVRFSWKPCQRALDKHAYPVKWTQFDESDGDETQQRLTFSTRYRFYTENNMEIVNDF